MSVFRLAGFALGLLALVGLFAASLSGALWVRPAGGLLAGAAALLAVDGVATGAVWSRGSEVERLGRPAAFWTTCASYAVFAVLMGAVAVGG